MISNPPGRLAGDFVNLAGAKRQAGDFANLAGANSLRILPLGARSR